MLVVWAGMLASLLAWRLFLYAFGAGVAWVLLPLVAWLFYSAAGLIYLVLTA